VILWDPIRKAELVKRATPSFSCCWGRLPFHLHLVQLNSLRTDGYFCHQEWVTEIAPKLRMAKHRDMTIHWKALEEHFLMVPSTINFPIQPFPSCCYFSKNLKSLKSKRDCEVFGLHFVHWNTHSKRNLKQYESILNWIKFFYGIAVMSSALWWSRSGLSPGLPWPPLQSCPQLCGGQEVGCHQAFLVPPLQSCPQPCGGQEVGCHRPSLSPQSFRFRSTPSGQVASRWAWSSGHFLWLKPSADNLDFWQCRLLNLTTYFGTNIFQSTP
jgi:hypothetical protein